MGRSNNELPDSFQVINVDLSVIKADLPAFTSEWTKCFVQIHVDASPNPVRTKTTKKAGQHEWKERFPLPARLETILRFELKRKAFLRQQSLAFAEARISDLLLNQQEAGQDQDLSIRLRPCLERDEKGDQWRLLVRLHSSGKPKEVVEERQVESIGSRMAEIVIRLEAFMAVGDAVAEMNPYAKIAWKIVSAFYTIIRNQVDRYARLDDLSGLMRDSYAFVENIKSFPEKIPALEGIIRALLSQTVECTMFFRECSGHGFAERLAFSAWTDRQIDGFTQSFTALKQSLETGTSIQAALVCFRLDDKVNRLFNTQAILKLGPADMDDAVRSECLPNTRIDVLTEIFAWITMPTIKSNVYWLHGFPGAGKSTIATSVAHISRGLRRLGAFIYFTRGVAARNEPSLLIRTLAYQLGEFDHRIGSAIAKVIEEVPSIRQAPLRWQFQKLLIEPFASLDDCLREGPILVVIDALDECGHSGAREELLKVLASESSRLPPTIRIFITSRAERDIRSAFTTLPHIIAREIDINSPTNDEDVLKYIHHRMVDIRLQNEFLDLPSDWPGKARTEALALRASGLFIWAYTACRYIEKGQDPEERLSQLVHSALYADAEAALDGIYITALECAGRWDDVAFAADFREIIGIIIVAQNPLTAQTIDLLNADVEGRKRRPCLHTIRHLGTVLQWAEDKPICVMHPSFADFITERRRCGSDVWFIDRDAHHLRVARLCIAQLRRVLKKNMCGLELSMSGWRVELPEAVVYPARYWVEHLCDSVTQAEEAAVEEIHSFLQSHFLHWIEVMTMMRRARQTIGLMVRLKEWVDTRHAEKGKLCAFVKDAVRFCQAYTHVYEQHPLLVYRSALPFTPRTTTVFQNFKDDPELPIVAGGFREHWSPLLIEFGRPGGGVVSISCSSDGQYIASTNTRNIFIWDSTSGELVTKPIFSGKSDFTVITFSPSNHRIASGSNDGRVRLWDALSVEQVGGTFEQHGGPVYALVFSNDASMLISASKDQTIVIWNVDDGSMVRAPLTGHQKTILSLAFSPIGSRFVSGSRDRSMRVWDASTGEAVLPPIIQRGSITSLAYTRDGNKIISGSDDRTIRIWDAHEGTLLYDPHTMFTGHKSEIFSIAVSPCGTLLASASKDTTVRLWEMSTGAELSHLVRQHRLPVRCVAFSHDGKRIVTGSHDVTVRVWDVESVGSIGGTRLHKGLVSHLAFSADGTRVVSGGLDKTVRVWCAETGQALMDPLRLEREVSAVAFDDDEHGETGIVRILAADKDGAVFAWDMATREPLMATPEDHPTLYGKEGPLVLEGNWIVDKTTNEALSLLPKMSPAKGRASCGNKIAIGLANGSIVILCFPRPLGS